VAAVRVEFRVAFSRARRPRMRPLRSSGQPTSRTAVLMAMGPTATMARTITPAPTALLARRCDADPEPVRASASPAAKSARARTARNQVVRLLAERRPWWSRIAWRGAAFVARSAGIRAAAVVTSRPTPSPISTVRSWKEMPAEGRLRPMAPNRALISVAATKPPRSPTSDAAIPIVAASSSTVPRTWRRVAPSARSSENSPIRSAIVIEKVLKMAKPPRSTAMNPNTNSPSVRIPRRSAIPAASALTWLWVLRTTSSGER